MKEIKLSKSHRITTTSTPVCGTTKVSIYEAIKSDCPHDQELIAEYYTTNVDALDKFHSVNDFTHKEGCQLLIAEYNLTLQPQNKEV